MKSNPKQQLSCLHRSAIVWPGTKYGACIACGAQVERVYTKSGAKWEAIATRQPQQRKAAPADLPTLWEA